MATETATPDIQQKPAPEYLKYALKAPSTLAQSQIATRLRAEAMKEMAQGEVQARRP